MKFKSCNGIEIIPALVCLFLIFTGFGQGKTLQLYILTGQSNSLGAVKDSPASAELLEQYKSDGTTKFWHTNFNKNSGRPVDFNPPPSTSWESIVPQVCGSATSSYNCMGPEYGFAAIMERKKWKLARPSGKDPVDIGIIKASLDGGGKNYWHKGTPAYKTIISSVNGAIAKALADGYKKVQIVGVIYLQGESNADAERVGDDFLTFLNNLESDISASGADTTLLKKQQAILGEHALWGTRNVTNPETKDTTAGDGGNTGKAGNTSDQQRALAESRKNMGWVPTRDLAKITKGDGLGVHYDGKSQITIGARYAYEAARLAGYDTGCVRNGNTTAPLCSPAAWTNRKLPLKSPAIWDVSSSVKDNITGNSPKEKAALYGIRIGDTYLNTVTIRGIMEGTTPSRKDSYLTIGKGGINIAWKKNLTIASVLSISGDQSWLMDQECSLHITSSDTAKSRGTLLFGSGTIQFGLSQQMSHQKRGHFPTACGSVIIDLAAPTGDLPYTGNWKTDGFITLRINGVPSSSPSILLDYLSIIFDKENTMPVLTVSGDNFLIQKGIILDIPNFEKKDAPISLRIINPDNNKLVKTLSKEKFFLSPRSKGWQIDSFDPSTGIITLSPVKPA